eukprot:NODE_3738_length_748_cov_113.686869.p1 GENE.NODE_3738_length_748_cov_113.686869~~NODE_3738_length_748_cov_113.686869.p1  ORF type:complete len:208 (-),score=43.21 NODE_3738_length_748_cov_113.686869:107-730(-)
MGDVGEPLPVVQEIKQLAGNARCVDCGANCSTDPWVSVTHGTVICIQCAGVHRSFGVHISFVRSLMLDTLKEREVVGMKYGGNEKLLVFIEAAEEGMARNAWQELPLASRYHTPVADRYRQHLRALVDATCPPKPQPPALTAPLPTPPPPPQLRETGTEPAAGSAASTSCGRAARSFDPAEPPLPLPQAASACSRFLRPGNSLTWSD